jgi:hypothetical protein
VSPKSTSSLLRLATRPSNTTNPLPFFYRPGKSEGFSSSELSSLNPSSLRSLIFIFSEYLIERLILGRTLLIRSDLVFLTGDLTSYRAEGGLRSNWTSSSDDEPSEFFYESFWDSSLSDSHFKSFFKEFGS